MHPLRDGWNPVYVDEEQHVPAGWGDIGLVGDFCAVQAGSLGEDVELHQPLASVERVGGHAILDEARSLSE